MSLHSPNSGDSSTKIENVQISQIQSYGVDGTIHEDIPNTSAAISSVQHSSLEETFQQLNFGDHEASASDMDSASYGSTTAFDNLGDSIGIEAPGNDDDDDDVEDLDDDSDDDDQVCTPSSSTEFCISTHDRVSHVRSYSYEDFEQVPSSKASTKSSNRASSSAVLTTLKKRWKGVKKAGAKSTASAGKSLSSLSANYFSTSREATKETREERHSRMGDEWISSILPSWKKKRKTARVRTLVFRGIPANVRGRVWQQAIGNPLNVSEQLFDVLKERAHAGRMEYMKSKEAIALADGDIGGNGGKAETMMENERSAHKAIMLDLPRTFPDLSFFHAEGSHYEFALRDILEAFLYLKPDVGYSQGMSFLAAILLLYMDPYDAFSCFVNMLLHKSCFLHFFKIKMPEVKIYLTVHERLLLEEMPSLYLHFQQHSIESNLYMINWVMSLYCRALPLDLVTRIWDLYVLDGDVAIFRAALGILRLFQNRLLQMKFEDMAYFLSHLPSDMDADALLRSIRSVRVVTKKRFRDLFKECKSAYITEDTPGTSIDRPKNTKGK